MRTRTTSSSEKSSAKIGSRLHFSIFFGEKVSGTSVRWISKPWKLCAVLNSERAHLAVGAVGPPYTGRRHVKR